MMRAMASGSLAFWMAGIVLAGSVGGVWYASRGNTPPEDAPPATAVSSGEADSEPGPSSVVQPASKAGDEPAGAEADTTEVAGRKLRLDEVRHEADGLLVIAGRAAPSTEVILRLDGSEVARASADGSGAFATVAILVPSDAARVLTLSQLDGAGGEIAAADELILAPLHATAPEEGPAAPGEPVAAEPPVVAATAIAALGSNEDGASAANVIVEAVQAVPAEPGTAGATAPETTAVPAAPGAEMLAGLQEAPERNDGEPEGQASHNSEPAPDPTFAATGSLVDAPQADPDASRADTPDPAAATIAADTPQDVDQTDEASDATARSSAAPEAQTPATEGLAQTTVAIDAADATPSSTPLSAASAEAEVAMADSVTTTIAGQEAPREEAGVTPPRGAPQVAILRSSEEGVSVVRPADPLPQVMRQVALDSISYSDAGDVELQGRAQDVARQVRVYLDNRPVVSLDVTASGNWRGSLPQVDTGVYTLRIDELDATGRVTSRVETPFKRESAEVLAAATANATAQVSAITVQRGDTLWAISRERYGDGILYVRVFEANRDSIRDPDLIYPGQIFTLPRD